MHCCFYTSRLSESKYVHSEIDSSTSNNKEKTRVPIFGILVFFIVAINPQSVIRAYNTYSLLIIISICSPSPMVYPCDLYTTRLKVSEIMNIGERPG